MCVVRGVRCHAESAFCVLMRAIMMRVMQVIKSGVVTVNSTVVTTAVKRYGAVYHGYLLLTIPYQTYALPTVP